MSLPVRFPFGSRDIRFRCGSDRSGFAGLGAVCGSGAVPIVGKFFRFPHTTLGVRTGNRNDKEGAKTCQTPSPQPQRTQPSGFSPACAATEPKAHRFFHPERRLHLSTCQTFAGSNSFNCSSDDQQSAGRQNPRIQLQLDAHTDPETPAVCPHGRDSSIDRLDGASLRPSRDTGQRHPGFRPHTRGVR